MDARQAQCPEPFLLRDLLKDLSLEGEKRCHGGEANGMLALRVISQMKAGTSGRKWRREVKTAF